MPDSLFLPLSTAASTRGRSLWAAPLVHRLPDTAEGWVAWYQARRWTVDDALHHACEARHHEVTIATNGRSRLALYDVEPGMPMTARHRAWAARTHGPQEALEPSGASIEEGWSLVRDAWRTNLLCWDHRPDPRSPASSIEVRKGEWQALLARYRLRGVQFPAYQDHRALYNRLLQLLERTRTALDLPASALGLNGRLAIVMGGCTFPDRDNLGGVYVPLSAGQGEIHLDMDQPWTAFVHEWFHALDHWLGQHPMLVRRHGAFMLDASDRGDDLGRTVEHPGWRAMLEAWHRANETRTTWDHPGRRQEHWNEARRTFAQRLARQGFHASSPRAAHERFTVYEAGCQARWDRALRHGEWSWMEEARILSAFMERQRVGDQAFDPSADLDAWESVFEGVVLLQQQQAPASWRLDTLRHATVRLHHATLQRTPIDPTIDPEYYALTAELNAWSFEAACDPSSQPLGVPLAHPWSVVRSCFPYAWGAEAQRERSAWTGWLNTLRPLLPGWA